MYKNLIALLACAFPLCALADDDCRYRADRSAEASVDGISRIAVVAGAGELKIEGVSERRNVQITGVACAARESALEHLQVDVERDGDVLKITTRHPSFGLAPGRWFADSSRIDLSIQVPVGMALDVQDGSGALRVLNVGALTIRDDSGPLHVEHIRGDVQITDGSGEITIVDIQGPVRVSDGSGEIAIEKIMGEVAIVNDGSGAIRIADVEGSVTIGNDGSGEIDIERVSGSVRIEEDGSGDIRVSTVRHDVSIGTDGSGSIVVENVDGDFEVRNPGSGGVRHERIGGKVRLAGEPALDEKVER